MESANFDQWEKTLAENQFLGGYRLSLNRSFSQQPTNADKEAFEQVKNSPPSPNSHPHTYAWFVLVRRFTDAVRNLWGGAAAGGAKGGKQAPKQEAKKEAPKKVEAEEDDFDPFAEGGDDEVSI